MLCINSGRNYYTYLIKISSINLLVGGLAYVIKPVSLMGMFILFFVLEVILVSTRYTKSITIDKSNLTIYYFRFLSRKDILIPLAQVKFKLEKKAPYRSSGYFSLSIFIGQKKIYEIDSRDGFDEDDLLKLSEWPHSDFA